MLRSLAVAPERVLYISCDPATLARDIKLLTTDHEPITTDKTRDLDHRESNKKKEGESENGTVSEYAKYRLERVQPFDMFPQTAHVETLCLLVRV